MHELWFLLDRCTKDDKQQADISGKHNFGFNDYFIYLAQWLQSMQYLVVHNGPVETMIMCIFTLIKAGSPQDKGVTEDNKQHGHLYFISLAQGASHSNFGVVA